LCDAEKAECEEGDKESAIKENKSSTQNDIIANGSDDSMEN